MRIRRERKNDQSGYMMVLSIVFTGVFTIIGIASLTYSNTMNKQARLQLRHASALHVAEAGVDMAVWKLNQKSNDVWTDWNISDSDLYTTSGQELQPSQYTFYYMGGQQQTQGEYDVQITNPKSNAPIVVATGYVPNKTDAEPNIRTVRVTLRSKDILDDVPGPLYTEDNIPHIPSNAFYCDGSDHPIGSPVDAFIPSASGGIHKPAISCTGDKMTFLSGINQTDRVRTRDDNDVMQTSSVQKTSDMDLLEMAASFVGTDSNGNLDGSEAETIESSGTFTQRIGDRWGSADNYKVTYINGDATLAGGGQVSSYGVLVVNGNLSISGQFQHIGIIIVLGSIKVTGGGSGIHTYGAILCGGELRLSDIQVTGNADIMWSSEAIRNVADLRKQNLEVYSWQELL